MMLIPASLETSESTNILIVPRLLVKVFLLALFKFLALVEVLEVAVSLEREFMISIQTAPEGFNNADWLLFPGNKNHVHFLPKCIELFWLIWECQQLTGEAFFGQEWLAKRLGITVRHVQNLIAELKSFNLIEIDRRDQNYYKVVEMFSQPPSYWTEVAKEKAKAALAKYFPSLVKQKANTQQASRPKRESTPKTAQNQATAQTPQASRPEPTVEERMAQEQKNQEIFAKMLAEQEAQHEAERKACQEAPEELKQDIEAVAEEIARENHNRPKPDPSNFCDHIKSRLQKYSIELPRELRGLISEIALKCLEKHRYKFR